ncbi:MAG: hypothetical protein BJ554DRAFT_4285 [Olpidium bornovanus]|uniref:Uncharacterized protein n=1 Tax=Olpidium bornovanus TaxID=278681 RepID=A0A8H7ZNA8_9FUNG|nr:MAG: hypothetical protein BJ554DRAFT_4285 [Olpidium bornovanus]
MARSAGGQLPWKIFSRSLQARRLQQTVHHRLSRDSHGRKCLGRPYSLTPIPPPHPPFQSHRGGRRVGEEGKARARRPRASGMFVLNRRIACEIQIKGPPGVPRRAQQARRLRGHESRDQVHLRRQVNEEKSA